MSNNLMPIPAPNPDRRHRRWSRSWKDTSKRAHQHRRVAYFVTEIIDIREWFEDEPNELVLDRVVYA